MKTVVIYNSYSGNTRSIAERVSAACGGRLVEVRSHQYSSRITAYTLGSYRAVKGLSDPIDPREIDVSADDLIVIGTPVWAGRATPAINAAVAALRGCAGKKAVIFATCGGKEREALPFLARALEERGVAVAGAFAIVFGRNGPKDAGDTDRLIAAVRSAGGAP